MVFIVNKLIEKFLHPNTLCRSFSWFIIKSWEMLRLYCLFNNFNDIRSIIFFSVLLGCLLQCCTIHDYYKSFNVEMVRNLYFIGIIVRTFFVVFWLWKTDKTFPTRYFVINIITFLFWDDFWLWQCRVQDLFRIYWLVDPSQCLLNVSENFFKLFIWLSTFLILNAIYKIYIK